MSSQAQEEVARIMEALNEAIVDHRLPPGACLLYTSPSPRD